MIHRKSINMNFIKLFILAFSLMIISSCEKNNIFPLDNDSYLIFGHFHGECLGETCIETFKLTENKLYEDSKDLYSNTSFNFVKLEESKFDLVKDLVDYFPEQLLDEKEERFGCPDCLDQGGLFIQYSDNGNVKSWRIDKIKSEVPEYLHEFIDKVNEKIALINR